MLGPLAQARSLFMTLLVAGLLPAGCSSVKAPVPGAQSPAASAGEQWETLWDLDAQSERDVPVESWEALEIDDFNITIQKAVGSGETWPRDPIDVVDQFIWGRISAYYTRLEKRDNRVEWADSTTITLMRDGYADDSVRGDWHRITLHRLPDGTWRLAEALRAFRCYRGHQQDGYGKRLCL